MLGAESLSSIYWRLTTLVLPRYFLHCFYFIVNIENHMFSIAELKPGEAVLDQARELGITVLTTPDSAFTTCGKLYEKGLRGVAIEWPESEDKT